MDPWLLAALVFLAYGAVIIILSQTGTLARASVQAVGPFLIWRTGRGRALLDRLARRARLWGIFARFSVYFVFATMTATVALIVAQAYLVTVRHTPPVNPQYAIGIPGINPIIPVGYGVLGLAVAIVVHEGCHGVLARVEKIKVRSVGLLLVLFPIGAFVEPDEAEMRAAPVRVRHRIFAVGPSSNLLLALLCAAIYSVGFIGSLTPVDDGVVITIVRPGQAAAAGGVEPYSLLTAMQNVSDPNATGPVKRIASLSDFDAFMWNATPGDNVTLFLVRNGQPVQRNVTMGLRPADQTPGPGEPPRPTAFLGVNLDTTAFFTNQARPGKWASEVCGPQKLGFGSGCYGIGFSLYLAMPVTHMSPTPPEVASLYKPAGPLASLGGLFWTFADAFYWLFWLNFMVGTFNALPMLPLDGGHMYRDAVAAVLRRRAKAAPAEAAGSVAGKPTAEPKAPERPRNPADDLFGVPRRLLDPIDRRASAITTYTSLFVLLLIVWQFVAPQLGQALGG